MKAHIGVDKREDMQEALNANGQTVQWHVAKRRKSIEKLADEWQKSMTQAYEKLKAQVRALREAPVSPRQEHLQIQEDALQGTGQERCPAQCLVCLEQFVHGQGRATPIEGQMARKAPKNASKEAQKLEKRTR
jgi:hypothetical protein